jgi:transcriptional regulator with XRE-family HTH domain
MKRRRDYADTEEDVRRRLSTQVRLRREEASLTQVHAAASVGIDRRHWQKVEAGETNFTLKTLARLGVALGVDPVALLKEPFPPAGKTRGR